MRIISNEELVVVSGGFVSNGASLQEVEARQSWSDLCDKIDAFNNDKNRIYQIEERFDW